MSSPLLPNDPLNSVNEGDGDLLHRHGQAGRRAPGVTAYVALLRTPVPHGPTGSGTVSPHVVHTIRPPRSACPRPTRVPQPGQQNQYSSPISSSSMENPPRRQTERRTEGRAARRSGPSWSGPI